MPKSPSQRSSARAAVATRSSHRISERAANSSPVRTPPRVVHTYSRKSPHKYRALHPDPSLSSLESDYLPSVEELLYSVGKALPPSAMDKINTHFRKLSRLVSKGEKEEARFTVETTAFRETLEGLYSEIIEKAKEKSNQLAEIAMIFERESRCAICASCVDNPVILVNCGHSFCASCIRDHFRESLKKKLADFRKEKGIYGTLPLPTTVAQVQEMSRTIAVYQGDASQIFSYQCPQCRGGVRKAPVVIYQLRSLLSEARTALAAYMTDGDNNFPSEQLPVGGFFDGFFV